MKAWYRLVTPRQEVREGRSFNPDEFAIALEQVVAGTAPEDYRNPQQFFARTCWTRSLREHAGMVLRRLSGHTENTAPVLTLITQFGGGKTHTLTALYHLVTSGDMAAGYSGVSNLLRDAGLSSVPKARVGVFVGNAWDPQKDRETPWIDLARQLAGDKGVEVLGMAAKTTPPGTETIARVFQAANAPVLLLFDEVLNFLNRHRDMAESFHAFIQNLTVATTGAPQAVAVISLPRSQVEMTDWDMQWQEKITRVVRRVARDLIVNDETEISEVIRRRLFENLGDEVKNVAEAYANWCLDRRAQLPPEWTAVDTAVNEAQAREYLRQRFESCYPFHPATLTVFQRKWQALPQFQQTRSTLAMLAQWIAWAYRDGFTSVREEPLITLGSAPLHDPGYRSTILGQLGESRLEAAIVTDIAGERSHARVLDADTRDALRDIHRRVGTAILFESSGGQTEKVAHLPDLRFALGGPGVDTTSVDNAASALESKSYFIRKIGTDGYQIGYKPTLRKVVNDRRASLDLEGEVLPRIRRVVEREFRRGAEIPLVMFPQNGDEVPDSPKLTLVIVEPQTEWTGDGSLRSQIAEWTKQRGKSPRLYPGALAWYLKKPGRELREKVELWLAWEKVKKDLDEGLLGNDFNPTERNEISEQLKTAEDHAKEEVWASYRYAVIYDQRTEGGLKILDLGAGHVSSGETLSKRLISVLRSEALLSDSVGASYIERNWPPAFLESGAWPLASLRQSFLNGSLTRLLDPDTTLKEKIVDFVQKGDFGLASGQQQDGSFLRVWFLEPLSPVEVVFEPQVFLLNRTRAQSLKKVTSQMEVVAEQPTNLAPSGSKPTHPTPPSNTAPSRELGAELNFEGPPTKIHIFGTVPPELWNRLGTSLLPKLRQTGLSDQQASDLNVRIDLTVTVNSHVVGNLTSDLQSLLGELGIANKVSIETTNV